VLKKHLLLLSMLETLELLMYPRYLDKQKLQKNNIYLNLKSFITS